MKREEKGYLTFREMKKSYEKMPPVEYIWSGIRKNSFGLVFGPAKSGKTIFCENMAMNIAMGKESYFGHALDGIPKKVLFVSLEEHWVDRVDRNVKQYMALNEEQQALIDENYRYQEIDFPKHVTKDKDWVNLETTMANSEAVVIIVDSVTRLTEGKIEGSDTAEKIMTNLRDICHKLGVTLIAIHHTPKMNGKEITMDSIKGSAVFSQESDFAIGVNKSQTGKRYIKNVFFRYAADDDADVREFTINKETIWLEYKGSKEEELLLPTDGRKNVEVKSKILDYFNTEPNTTRTSSDVIEYFLKKTDLKERQIKTHVSNLVGEGKIKRRKRGLYSSMNATTLIQEGELNE